MATGNMPMIIIIGAGGIGLAAARRLGSGQLLVLADANASVLASSVSQLESEGHNVRPFPLDITQKAAVSSFAAEVSSLGQIQTVVHTAGVSPPRAPSDLIYRVNLLGTAHLIEAFEQHMPAGSSMVCLSSSAAHFGKDVNPDAEKHLATAAPEELLSNPCIDIEKDDNGKAYRVSKKGNLLRAQAAALAFGDRGVRINVISPGIVATSMGQDVLAGPNGERVRGMMQTQPIKRIGTPGEIAEGIAFLAGPGASYMTASELLMDGGSTAKIKALMG